MQYFTEQAPSHHEALDRIRAKYGEQAQVLSHRTVRTGGLLGLFTREAVEVTGYIKPLPRAEMRPAVKPDFEEEKRKILEKAKSEQVRSDEALGKVLDEIRDLKKEIGDRARAAPDAENHEAIRRADALLSDNDFSEGFRRAVIASIRRDFTLEALEDWDSVEEALLDRIGDSIEIWREEPPRDRRGPRVIALVGPTGVGKTTTIAKLAAIFAVGIGGEKPRSVRMITIDNYRIGARQQIETYGDIMGVPVSCVETAEDLKKTLALHSDADLVLVDTIGKSPRDAVRLAEMQRLIAACGPQAEVHLAVTATMKASDMAETLRQFEPFGYRGVVLTKLDETNRVGNAVSVLAERGKPLAYVTTGQRVPQDIERATVQSLLTRLEGFYVDRARIEERYGEAPPRNQAAARRTTGGAGGMEPHAGDKTPRSAVNYANESP